MKVKKYRVEVVRTDVVEVTLPEGFLDEELLDEWERGLWPLEGETPEEKLGDIATYAAHMALVAPNGGHDGLGYLITSNWGEKPDYKKDSRQVVAIEQYGDVDTVVLEEGQWVVVDLK